MVSKMLHFCTTIQLIVFSSIIINLWMLLYLFIIRFWWALQLVIKSFMQSLLLFSCKFSYRILSDNHVCVLQRWQQKKLHWSNKTQKSKHLRKLDDFCTARMIATEHFVDGRVEVKYYSNHTNHQLNLSECGNLPLPKSIEEEIKQQCAAGIPIERIMESMWSMYNCYVHTQSLVYFIIMMLM